MLNTWRTAPRGGVAHHHHSAHQQAEADDAALSVRLAKIFDLDGHASEDPGRFLEVQAALFQSPFALDRDRS
jgi:hypothetical protein